MGLVYVQSYIVICTVGTESHSHTLHTKITLLSKYTPHYTLNIIYTPPHYPPNLPPPH